MRNWPCSICTQQYMPWHLDTMSGVIMPLGPLKRSMLLPQLARYSTTRIEIVRDFRDIRTHAGFCNKLQGTEGCRDGLTVTETNEDHDTLSRL